MEITQVTINACMNDPHLKAFASFVIDGWLVVHQIKLLHGQNGYFLEMPKRKRPGKHALDLAFPLNDKTRQMILKAIVAEYQKVCP